MLHQKPVWMDGVVLTGRELEIIGLAAPILAPEQALLIECTIH